MVSGLLFKWEDSPALSKLCPTHGYCCSPSIVAATLLTLQQATIAAFVIGPSVTQGHAHLALAPILVRIARV
jgi:hypothetical protein